MATAAIATNTKPTYANGGVGFGGVKRNIFGTQISTTEGNRVSSNDGGNGNTMRDFVGGGVRVRTVPQSNVGGGLREIDEDPIEETEEPQTKRAKVVEENWEVPAQFYGQIVGMLEGFRTKGTIWYNSPDAEKKRDKSAFVLWKGRTKNDGSMTLSIMDPAGTIREVVATEVSVAQQFKDIFDPQSASRIFELIGNGTTIQKAVFQTLNEQADGSGSD